MDTIRTILEKKGHHIISVQPSVSILDAIRTLAGQGVGALLVMEESGKLVGIFTERDVLRQVAKNPETLTTTQVSEIMTRELIVGVPDDELDYVSNVMTENRFRHLPVLENGTVVGLISIGDVVKTLKRAKDYENHLLKDYISGSYPA